MIESFASIDEAIFLALHNIARGDFMDTTMWMISDRWIWVAMYVALTVWIIRSYGWSRGFVIVVAIGLAAACADQLCASFIRPYVERLRPANPDNPLSAYVTVVNDYRGGAFGFPSCHAANTFALAAFVSMMCRGRAVAVWMFGWAIINCFSRIYLGVHYPGDLLVGAILGSSLGVIWWFVARAVAPRLGIGPILPRTASWRVVFALVGYITFGIIVVVSFF